MLGSAKSNEERECAGTYLRYRCGIVEHLCENQQ